MNASSSIPPSLVLYHWEPNANSLRPMICLHEKGLAFTSRYVDVLRFEQHQPDFLALNPRGEVPVLVHDDVPFYEVSFIEAYLDEVFPAMALMPRDAVGRWRVRVWQKRVDEDLAPAVSLLGCQRDREALIAGRLPNELQHAIANIPAKERRDVWQAALCDGYGTAQLQEARRKIAEVIADAEAQLTQHPWLADATYSLADGAAFAFIMLLPQLTPDLVNARTTPQIMRWLAAMHARPAVVAALRPQHLIDPCALIAPGPEPIRWG